MSDMDIHTEQVGENRFRIILSVNKTHFDGIMHRIWKFKKLFCDVKKI